MYQDLKLEKGMYHITGKSFSEVLEGMDPSGAYAETPLAGLDAYERQLKRFDIHVSGSHCDRVEKFFSTTDSAVLFPEFIRRAIRSGMEQSVLSDLVAVHTISPAGEYQPAVLTDTTAYTTKTTQGNALPTASYLEAATPCDWTSTAVPFTLPMRQSAASVWTHSVRSSVPWACVCPTGCWDRAFCA